ncbi:MAG: DUF5777 family beta-barrel protein [Bacteroidota bacterium]
MKPSLLLFILCFPVFLFAQEKTLVTKTFKDTRVINSHSVETLGKRKLDFRVSHRFGDIASEGAGWATLYGLENAADILIGFEYGLSDDLMIGFNRTKGDGPLRQLLNGFVKYRILKQTEGKGMPITLTMMAGTSMSTMKKTDDPFAINFFDKFSHRLMYSYHAIFGKKFSDGFSLQITGSYVHRNIVPLNDENNVFAVGMAMRLQLNKVFGLVLDATYPVSHTNIRNTGNDYYFPLGIGLEMDTGGHVFQINFTNSKGISDTDYIPNTRYNWGDGEFRLGFTISRQFKL